MFVADGVGAIVTAAAVGLVLPALPGVVGMPVAVLRTLGAVASGFALWSLTCAAILPQYWPWCLRVVAVLNAGYCVATAACLVRFGSELRALDLVYFPLEIVVVAGLAAIEWWVAARAATSRV